MLCIAIVLMLFGTLFGKPLWRKYFRRVTLDQFSPPRHFNFISPVSRTISLVCLLFRDYHDMRFLPLILLCAFPLFVSACETVCMNGTVGETMKRYYPVVEPLFARKVSLFYSLLDASLIVWINRLTGTSTSSPSCSRSTPSSFPVLRPGRAA